MGIKSWADIELLSKYKWCSSDGTTEKAALIALPTPSLITILLSINV
jgi:hypothetical protein